jgi:hypothetical protein
VSGITITASINVDKEDWRELRPVTYIEARERGNNEVLNMTIDDLI